jgi:hypothetical protein
MNQPTTPPPAPTCAGCAHHEPACAYCSLLGERRKASDTACGQRTDGKVERVTVSGQDPARWGPYERREEWYVLKAGGVTG